jgi:hypothetical protein
MSDIINSSNPLFFYSPTSGSASSHWVNWGEAPELGLETFPINDYQTVEKPAFQRLMENVQMQGFRNPEE